MRKRNVSLTGFFILSLVLSSMALKPYWNSNMLFFQNEAGEIAKQTRFVATLCGVETWYKDYLAYIDEFVSNGPFDFWLYDPWNGWRFREVNAYSLTESIWFSYWLDLGDIPWDAYNKIYDALTADRGGNQPSYWDPYWSWKWRSKYIETRYSENGDTADANANCWGTADYLAKDGEWIGEYQTSFPSGANNDGDRFPHIYIWGSWSPNPYKIDNDLDGTNGNVELLGWDSAANYPSPQYVLNTFDVVRLSGAPYSGGPRMFNVDVGDNEHCLAYLCTGEQRWWDIDPSSQDYRYVAYVYEKHNYGNTLLCPYGINILGHDDWAWDEPPVGGVGDYDLKFNAYFKKYGYNKQNLTSYWCESWPDDGRIPQIIRDDETEYYGGSCNN